MSRGKTWSDAELADLREMWAQGYSASFIADRMNITRNSVMGRVHRLGMKRRPLSYSERVDLFAEYLAQGYTVRAAAYSMGVPKVRALDMLAQIRHNLGEQAI